MEPFVPQQDRLSILNSRAVAHHLTERIFILFGSVPAGQVIKFKRPSIGRLNGLSSIIMAILIECDDNIVNRDIRQRLSLSVLPILLAANIPGIEKQRVGHARAGDDRIIGEILTRFLSIRKSFCGDPECIISLIIALAVGQIQVIRRQDQAPLVGVKISLSTILI